MKRQLRVLHAPQGVGGNAWHLSRAERVHGVKSDVLVFDGNVYGFKYDHNLRLQERSWLKQKAMMWPLLLKLIPKYDIFHFNFGESLVSYPRIGMYHLDFWLIKRFRKLIVITYQGCDIRSFEYSTRAFGTSACEECRICEGQLDQAKKKKSQIVRKYVDHVYYLNPDLAHVVPKEGEFRPYTKFALDHLIAKKSRPLGNPIRILHAPTDRAIKGSAYIIEACKELKEKGYAVELKMVEGLSQEQAFQEYKKADIFVDQLLVGWYGGLAVEGMALEKPVLAYLRYSDFDVLPGPMSAEIPIVHATKDTLVEVLQQLIENPNRCSELGRKGRKYVEKWHDPAKIALKTKALYERLVFG
jgi:glycosyltransferase involved in cell wall biosynthesis